MKILVLCYEYPPIGGGGGRVAKAVAEGLAARGHDVRVQTAGMSHLASCENVGAVEVFRTRSFRRREDTCAVHEMGLYVVTSFVPTLRHIRGWKPDVIHAHFAMPTGLLAWGVHALTRVPYVLTAHLGDVPGGVPEQTDHLFRFVGPLARRVWRDASAATAVSSFVRDLAVAAYQRPVTTIFNGIELAGGVIDQIAEVPRSKRLVFIGRFNPQKRPTWLLHSLAGLLDLEWQLTMIGDGPLRSAVRERIESLRLSDRVRLTGWLPAAEVQCILRESDILCMSSTSEGMPVAAVEALNHGLAIVATDIPGMRDVLEDGTNGYVAAVDNPAAFAEKIRRLLHSDQKLLSMMRASLQKARMFDLRAIVAQYETVLQRVADQAKGQST